MNIAEKIIYINYTTTRWIISEQVIELLYQLRKRRSSRFHSLPKFIITHIINYCTIDHPGIFNLDELGTIDPAPDFFLVDYRPQDMTDYIVSFVMYREQQPGYPGQYFALMDEFKDNYVKFMDWAGDLHIRKKSNKDEVVVEKLGRIRILPLYRNIHPSLTRHKQRMALMDEWTLETHQKKEGYVRFSFTRKS